MSWQSVYVAKEVGDPPALYSIQSAAGAGMLMNSTAHEVEEFLPREMVDEILSRGAEVATDKVVAALDAVRDLREEALELRRRALALGDSSGGVGYALRAMVLGEAIRAIEGAVADA